MTHGGAAKAIFLEAIEIDDPAARAEFISDRCGADDTLRRRVQELLAADAADGALDRPIEALVAGDPPVDRPSSRVPAPRSIGPFTIVRELGAGGMGIVYEAVQDSPRRTVAVKVMRSSLVRRREHDRFLHETRVLAHLEHAGIARIYEAGLHDDGAGGVPYFSMEYVPEAASLTVFAEREGLDPRQRVELFIAVCDAVHYAHQRGVVHRDLKPGNILVDAKGCPRIIDFGVARATDADISLATLQTESGVLVGTLRYMSPEQCAGDPYGVDTRSDVYALGVILFELLTGQCPYDLTGASAFDLPRIIRDDEPRRLSTVSRVFGGDLDAIITMALEKDPSLRYGSVEALADDLRRHLDGAAVNARQGRRWYALRKSIRRHRVAASVAAAFVVLVCAAAVALAVMYLEVETQRNALQSAITTGEHNRFTPLLGFEDDFDQGPSDPQRYWVEYHGRSPWRDGQLVLDERGWVAIGLPQRPLEGAFELTVDWVFDRWRSEIPSDHWIGLKLLDVEQRPLVRVIRECRTEDGAVSAHRMSVVLGDGPSAERVDRPWEHTVGRVRLTRRGNEVRVEAHDGDGWIMLKACHLDAPQVFLSLFADATVPAAGRRARFDDLRIAMLPDVPEPVTSMTLDFGDGVIDPRFTIDKGYCGLPFVADGRLVLEKRSGCDHGPALYLDWTRWVLRGDVDISVRYARIDWPIRDDGEARFGIRLRRADDFTYVVSLDRFEQASVDVRPRSAWSLSYEQQVYLSEQYFDGPSEEGMLRLVRRGGELRAMVSAAGGWRTLDTREVTETDLVVGLYAWSLGLSGRAVAFDDLRILTGDDAHAEVVP